MFRILSGSFMSSMISSVLSFDIFYPSIFILRKFNQTAVQFCYILYKYNRKSGLTTSTFFKINKIKVHLSSSITRFDFIPFSIGGKVLKHNKVSSLAEIRRPLQVHVISAHEAHAKIRGKMAYRTFFHVPKVLHLHHTVRTHHTNPHAV